ncbi:hypothetical protein [Streptomyces sp. NBC_01794]|uniref:hypothetical protein n=1 Tax=Streptomyces sp. NBC_01794 TaxID=2975942 RepID=UPI00308BB444|nr:hypothetical protein OIE54_09420 [Streptomyces sp. NBC_01794]
MTATALPRTENALARRITDWMEPSNVIVLVSLCVGAAQDNSLTGLAWALEAIVFAAAIPMAYIQFGMRRGMWADRHIGQRQRRMLLIPVIMASVATGIGLMVGLDAPKAMVALVVAMLVTLAVLLPVTAFWKISVHTAVAGGALAMLSLTWSPLVWIAYPIVAAIAWSRISLRDHTLAQTIAGAVAGTATAGLVFAALSS